MKVTAVPEPSPGIMIGVGFAGWAIRRRLRQPVATWLRPGFPEADSGLLPG
jgi:hypothetical protein